MKQIALNAFMLKTIMIVSIVIVFQLPIFAQSLNYVPMESELYHDLCHLNNQGLFGGNRDVSIYTLPLKREDVARLLDRALRNVQQNNVIYSLDDIRLLETLITEFEDELKQLGVRVFPKTFTAEALLQAYQTDTLYKAMNCLIQDGYIASDTLNPPVSRKQMAALLNEFLVKLQTGEVNRKKISSPSWEALNLLTEELKPELEHYGIKVVYLDKGEVMLDYLEETLTLNGYVKQLVNLKQNTLMKKPLNESIKTKQGLAETKVGLRATGSVWDDVDFYLDISADAQIYDMYNLDTALLGLHLNQGYLSWTTKAGELQLPEDIPVISLLDEFEIPALTFQLGRDENRWGPGYQGSLALSDNVAFNMLKYSGNIDLDQFGKNLGNVNFTKLFAPLDNERFFIGQRFEYTSGGNWHIGLSETAIASLDCGLGYYNPIPFPLVNYLTQQVYANFPDLSHKENNINYNIGLDVSWIPQNDMQIYGEILFDDFIFYQQTNPYPGRYGLSFGTYLTDIWEEEQTDLRLEYTRINNYVYFPRQSWQNYLYKDTLIGHPLGPDADQILLQLEHQLEQDLSLQLAYIHERHGEGQYGESLSADANEANENRFLSGTVEKSHCISASLDYDINKDWQFSITGSLKNIFNDENQLGQDNQELAVSAKLQYAF